MTSGENADSASSDEERRCVEFVVCSADGRLCRVIDRVVVCDGMDSRGGTSHGWLVLRGAIDGSGGATMAFALQCLFSRPTSADHFMGRAADWGLCACLDRSCWKPCLVVVRRSLLFALQWCLLGDRVVYW